jgi:pimeloyl-ACP methyl ester carboxylesterase
VGHSLGAAIATDLALAHPERVTRVALLAPVGFSTIRRVRLGAMVAQIGALVLVRRSPPRLVFEAALRSAYGRLKALDARDIDEYWSVSRDPRFFPAMRDLIGAYRWRPFETAELRSLRVPMLVMLGAIDPLIQCGPAASAARTLPNATVEVVGGCGHVIPEEAASIVNASLIRFFGAAELLDAVTV